MTIRTMEALEALPVGESIKVTNNVVRGVTFTRTASGFDWQGFNVEPKWFAGHIAAGHVITHDTSRPDIGDMFLSGRHYYVIWSVDDPLRAGRFDSNGTYIDTLVRTMADARGFRWRRVTDLPTWHRTAVTLGAALETQRVAHTEAATARDEARQEAIAAADQVMRASQLRAAQVQVKVTGRSHLPTEKASGGVPEGAGVTDVFAVWEVSYTVTTEPVSGCQCGVVTRPWVAQRLGVNEGAEFSFTVDCGRH